MKNWRQLLCNERGTALALALIIMVIMTALAVGLATMGGVESRISASLSAGSRARLLAESGIEYALLSLAGINFTAKLAGGSVLIPDGTILPGLTAASGTFGVTIRNDTAGDILLTGANAVGCITCASAEGGNATADSNGVVILTSTGVVDGASRVVVAVVQRGNLDIQAALTLPGVQADTTTDSPCQNPNCPPNPMRTYSIDGRDWLPTDTDASGPTGTAPRKLGIATGLESTVEGAFNDSYKRAYVQGKHESTGALTTGLNTINTDSSVTKEHITKFMTNLASNPATQIIQSTQACAFGTGGDHNKPEGIHLASTGTPNIVTIKNNFTKPGCGTASTKIDKTINLGSPTSPQMIYFKGEFDENSDFTGVGVDGSQAIEGYGLLVVEDADLAFFQTGKFRWNGIVLVTGRNVAVAFKEASDTEIRGALIGSETNISEASGYFEFYNRTRDTMILRASQKNVDLALMALYNMRVTSYREREACSIALPC